MKKYIYKEISKILLVTITILIVLILTKNNIEFKNKIKYLIYEDNISFVNFKKIYNKYLGGIYFLDNKRINNTYTVFDSKLSYKKIEDKKEYIKLEVENNYLVPSIEEGIVIFIGYKEIYGNTIIIQTNNNINIWYGNIENTQLKIYDNIKKGDYIGEVNDNTLYIAYSKGNNMLKALELFNK